MNALMKIANCPQTIELLRLAKKPQGLKSFATSVIDDIKTYRNECNMNLLNSVVFTATSVWYAGPEGYMTTR